MTGCGHVRGRHIRRAATVLVVAALAIGSAPLAAAGAVGVSGLPGGSSASTVTSPNSEPSPATAAAAPTLPPTEAPAAACTGTQDRPQLEPEALGTMNVRSDDPAARTAASLGYDGSGVKVGIVTSPMDPTAPDFQRPDGRSAVVDYTTYAPGGPEAGGPAAEGFGDVSSIVAQGAVTHDLATIVDPAAVVLPDGHCWIRIVGVAPAADVSVATAEGAVRAAGGAVQAIDDAVASGVDVISLSFGTNSIPDVSRRNAIQESVEAAIDAGVVVVASTGDAGPNSTIGSPAAHPRVISVGATVTGRLLAQAGFEGVTRFGDGRWPGGTAATFSSSGFTMGGRTIDVVAPGDTGWSVCSSDPRFSKCGAVGDPTTGADLIPFAGTSESAPFVAGVVALVIQAYRETHDGRRPTPDDVRRIISGTATDLGLPAEVQGSGQVDAYAAVLAARALGNPPAVDAAVGGASDRTLVADVAQRTVTGSGELPVEVTVTNTGGTAVLMDGLAVTRDEPVDRQTFPFEFDPAASTFVDGLWNAPTVAVRQSFTVAPGAAQIGLAIGGVPNAAGATFPVQLVVLDPSGTPVAAGRGTQGLQLQVPAPAAGEWTAVVMTEASTAFSGELAVERTERQVISTARSDVGLLVPGASTTVTARIAMPTEPGDDATTLRIADRLALPIIRRVPVDLASGIASVTGAVRPQTGRQGAPAQQAVWEFDVPAGRRSLDVAAVVEKPAVLELQGSLIGPDGVVRSGTENTDGGGPSPATAVSQTVADPEPGRWRYVLSLVGTSWSVPATTAPFRVTVGVDRVTGAADNLPTGSILTAGTSRTVTLSIVNPGPVPLPVVVDSRTDSLSEIDLPITGTGPTLTIPAGAPSSDSPQLTVPLFSTRLSVSAQATVPLLMAVQSAVSVPAVLSDRVRPDDPVVTTDPRVVVGDAGRTPGPWSISVRTPGPVLAPTPGGTATLSARVETATYDTTVTDESGRPLVTSTGLADDNAPTMVPAGGRVAIPVVLPVRGAPGERSAGFLALTVPALTGPSNGSTSAFWIGDVLAVFPYDYTVAAAPDPTTSTPTPDPTTSTPTPDPTTSSPVPVTVPTVTIPTVTIAPVKLAPFTLAVAPPVNPPTYGPQQLSSAPSGTLPTTGFAAVTWTLVAFAIVALGVVAIGGGRRLGRRFR